MERDTAVHISIPESPIRVNSTYKLSGKYLQVLFLFVCGFCLTTLLYIAQSYSNNVESEDLILNMKMAPELGNSGSKIQSISEWDQDRNYGIIIDAGSSGSRIYLYSWKSVDKLLGYPKAIEIEKGTQGDTFQMKVEPGISSFEQNPQNVQAYLKPLLDFAVDNIPVAKHSTTPIYLFATAGMRIIPKDAQIDILRNICSYITDNYNFWSKGGCDKHFRIISGKLEGIFGWVTVNYLKHHFLSISDSDLPSSYGFVDLGGASAQIAFEPTKNMAIEHMDDLTDLKIRLLDGNERNFKLFVASFLGFGANQAYERYKETISIKSDNGQANDPCLPSGYSSSVFMDGKDLNITGSGNFPDCLDVTKPLLKKELPCPEEPCLFNGVHAPLKDMRNHHFLGVSEFWWTTFNIFDKGGVYDFHSIFDQANEYCSLKWDTILEKFRNKKIPNVDQESRLKNQCFKISYIMNMLHEGLKLPKETATSGRPIFESLQELGGFETDWTLGAMFLHASSTIPSAFDVSYAYYAVGLFLIVCFVVLLKNLPKRKWRRLDVNIQDFIYK